MTQLAADTPAVINFTADWLAVYKPTGWLTIPPSPPRQTEESPAVPPTATEPVLSTWLRERFPEALVAHRIDRETSGLVLFARSPEAHRRLNDWFQRHEIKKTYECIAAGEAPAPMFKVTHPIGGLASTTQFEVKRGFKEGFLAIARPVTGRRHQIRIHLSMDGHPLWGDRTYRGPTTIAFENSLLAVPRVALHASRIELPTKEVFESYLPKDFKAWAARLIADGTRL